MSVTALKALRQMRAELDNPNRPLEYRDVSVDDDQARAILDYVERLTIERATLRNLVQRAQISGDRLPVAWHTDAKAAMNA